MKKRFIEWNLPLTEISEHSAKEKSIKSDHPSTIHLWWSRKPLSACRAINFSALIDLPDDNNQRQRLFDLTKKISSWDAVKNGNDDNIKKAQELINDQWSETNPPSILDPFSGGGSIPLEALRLGCESYANDYNPVAVLIEKATLEWPQKFGIMIPHPNKRKGIDGEVEKSNFLVFMIEKWAKQIQKEVKLELNKFYPNGSNGSIPVGYYFNRTIPCQNPNCSAEIVLTSNFWIANKKNRKVAYKPIKDNIENKITFKLLEENKIDFDPDEKTVFRANAKCLLCGQITTADLTKKMAKDGKMGHRMIAVVSKVPNKSGKIYRIANEDDIKSYKQAEIYLEEKIKNWKWFENPLPDEKMASVGTYGIDAQRYTVNEEWMELFNPRQKLALISYMEKIKLHYADILEDCRTIGLEKYDLNVEEAAKAIIGYLGLILNNAALSLSILARYRPDHESFQKIFARPALPVMWDYGELNGLNAFNYSGCIKGIIGACFQNRYRNKKISITRSSATSLPFPDNKFDAVITDPPYYDNVPYADLSDFLYVWLKRSVGDHFPDLFSTPLTPKSEEAISEKMRQKNPKEFFEKSLSKSFKEIHRILKQNGIAIIVYAHKTTAGWETMLNSLIDAGLVVTASWPIHTEMKSRIRATSSAALASSIYMVCRKTHRKDIGFYSEIKPKIKKRIEEKLQQFWNEGISGGDFFISAIGPGMEIFSQYNKVEKLSGEKVTTIELLDYIRTVSTDYIVNKLLKNTSLTKIDNESEFYLAFRWTYQDNTVEYDDARKLASASGVNLEKLWGSDGFINKSGSNISVIGPKQRNKIDKTNNMVDVMHKSVLLWERGERDKLSKLLTETGYGKDPAFKQFCQAIAESLINGNKEKQLLEGFLIGIDAYTRGKVKTPKDQTDLKQFGGN